MSRFLYLIFSICYLLGLAITTASAQEPELSDTAVTASNPRPIEEITVVGQQSITSLRFLVTQKQEEIFNFFNENNSSNRFDITCSKRAIGDSRILTRECEPRFLKDIRAEKVRVTRVGGPSYTRTELVWLSEEDFEKLQNEMLSVLSKNKEFGDALVELADLEENLKAHRKELFED